MARRADKVNFTLDFIDSGHLLLTYNPKKMIVRLPECPPTHDDHYIHAAILEIDTGKVLSSVDWYLHDGRRYLWPLGSGKFLLRKLNSLYLLDSNLNEKLLLNSPHELLWVTVTPDGKQIITETIDDEHASKSKKKLVRIEFRDSQTMEVQRVIKSEKEAHIEATSSGFASVIPSLSRKVWLVRFGLSEQQRDNITRVRTRLRTPDVLYLSSNAILIGRDSASHPGYSVSAFTVTGNFLWRQHWDEHRYSLLVERSEDGSRFAVSTLRLRGQSPGIGNNSSDLEGLEQTVQVFNTGSGEAVLSVDAMPVVLSGQNFALSPDGRKLAVLHGSSVDLYDLPEMSPDEKAKYTAVKADVPGLYAPRAPSEADSNEAAFTAADANGAAPANVNPEVTDSSNANPAQSHTPGAAPTSSTATKSATQDLVPTFKSQRQIVALDVVVADAKGHPIKDISKEQFVVKEDGKPQTISFFDEVHASSSAPAPPQTPPDPKANTKPADIFTNDKPPQVPSAITVILYDLLNTPAPEQQSAKLELLNFIEHKPKDERFALCTLTDGLRMIQGLTPDENMLARALKRNKGSLSYSGLQGEEESDRMLVGWLQQGAAKNLAQFGANAGGSSSALSDMAGRMEQDMAARRSRDLEMRMALTTDAFTQLARYLSALPGRKSLIWLSGSFPLGIFPGIDFRDPYSENKTEGDQRKRAVNLLAESHVAVYPVDVRGLSNFPATASTSNSGLDLSQPAAQSPSFNNQISNTQRFDELSNLNSAGGIGPNLANNSPFMDEAMDHGIMDKIAADTGGKAFYNANGIEQAMDVAVEQETNYYALSYTSLNKKYDGKFRKIKVSLVSGEKKYHLIHRSGYYAVDPDAPSPLSRDATTGFGLASMQHDAPESRQLLFEARVVPIGKPLPRMDSRPAHSSTQTKKKKHQSTEPPKPIEMQRYDIDYAITPSQLHFDSTPDKLEHGAMNFMVASFDADGTVRTSIASHVKDDLKPEEYNDVMTGGLRLHEDVDVPVAAASLRIGVQDAITGLLGTVEIPLPVKAPPGVEQSRRQRMPEIEPD
ncbi:MAG TPA: VWA domain-containing protein [Terriglobales bacterium]|nr:VWA domain-containing protein [Terriglobales bacterium]